MFGKKTFAKKKSENYSSSNYPASCCQICGAKLVRQKGKKVETNKIVDYKTVHSAYTNKRVSVPVYGVEREKDYFACPRHGTAGVSPKADFWL